MGGPALYPAPVAEWQRVNPQRTWVADHVAELVSAVAGVLLLAAAFLPGMFREAFSNAMVAGQLGDFVGGYAGSYFALLSMVLLFAALRNQRRSAATQNFETRYFELIKLHRENVAEMRLEKYAGRRIFVLLVRELRAIHEVVVDVSTRTGYAIDTLAVWQISFCCLFYGVGPNSSRMLKKSLEQFSTPFIDSLEIALNSAELKERHRKKLRYVPFEGHQSRLGHYYRHLFQTVHYVDQQKLDIDKYGLVKTIRAQLTTHEQALLLINSLAPFGRPWWRDGLMVRYRMIHNLPRHFFDPVSELDVEMLFPRRYFEWEDVGP